MKLDYKDWNEADKAPAKTRYVKNAIELSERRMRLALEARTKKIEGEMAKMATHTKCCIAISVLICIIVTQRGQLLRFLRKILSDNPRGNL